MQQKSVIMTTVNEINAIINIYTEEIWRSSNETMFLSLYLHEFQGACLDTGTQKIVAYFKEYKIRYK